MEKVKIVINNYKIISIKHIIENGFDLERGKEREVEHLSTEKLKQITNYDNIKYEVEQEEIQPLKLKIWL